MSTTPPTERTTHSMDYDMETTDLSLNKKSVKMNNLHVYVTHQSELRLLDACSVHLFPNPEIVVNIPLCKT